MEEDVWRVQNLTKDAETFQICHVVVDITWDIFEWCAQSIPNSCCKRVGQPKFMINKQFNQISWKLKPLPPILIPPGNTQLEYWIYIDLPRHPAKCRNIPIIFCFFSTILLGIIIFIPIFQNAGIYQSTILGNLEGLGILEYSWIGGSYEGHWILTKYYVSIIYVYPHFIMMKTSWNIETSIFGWWNLPETPSDRGMYRGMNADRQGICFHPGCHCARVDTDRPFAGARVVVWGWQEDCFFWIGWN